MIDLERQKIVIKLTCISTRNKNLKAIDYILKIVSFDKKILRLQKRLTSSRLNIGNYLKVSEYW